MASGPRDHRREQRRRGRRRVGVAARGVGTVLVDPAVITVEELAAAAEFAARDGADFDAEWAVMSPVERDWFAAGGDEVDQDGHYLAAPEPVIPDMADCDGGGPVVAGCGSAAGRDPAGRDAVDAADRLRWWEARWLTLAGDGGAGATAWELLAAATAAPGTLGTPDAPGRPGSTLEQLRCLDRLSALLAGHRHGLIGALCPVDDDSPASFRAEAHLVEEIAVATRVGPTTAARAIEAARLLGGPLRPSREDLLTGAISDAHVRVLVWETRNLADDPTAGSCPDCADCTDTDADTAAGACSGDVTGVRAVVVDPPGWRTRDDKLAQVQARVGCYARTQTPTQFAATVRTAIAAVDPDGEADRHAAAKKARDVTTSRDSDGIGVLVDRDDAATVEAIHAALTDAAKVLQAERGGVAAARNGDPDARLGACRADVLKTLVLGPHPAPTSSTDTGGGGAPTDTGSDSDAGPVGPVGPVGPGPGGSWEPRRRDLEGHLVIDVATLRGEADNPVLLDGQPIPAPIGRHLAASVKAWRRMVTDPVTGHLLDYGRRVYLPEPLVAFTKARDGTCAAPYCERPARRCQMDHRKRFPDGPSAAWNCGSFCDRHHPLKTDGWIDVTDSDATGAITYRTLWGQTVTTSPHPYLPDPRPPTSESELGHDTGPPGDTGPPEDDEEPPF